MLHIAMLSHIVSWLPVACITCVNSHNSFIIGCCVCFLVEAFIAAPPVCLSRQNMLLLALLVFFSFSFDVSSAQYYASENCARPDTPSPCRPFSVYARNMSLYSNSVFYFIGDNYINSFIGIHEAENITLQGLGEDPLLSCRTKTHGFGIREIRHFSLTGIALFNCQVRIIDSTNISITDSIFYYANEYIYMKNAFNLVLSHIVLYHSAMYFEYTAPSKCSNETQHYSLSLFDVEGINSFLLIQTYQSRSYNLSVKLDRVNVFSNSSGYVNSYIEIGLSDSLYSVNVVNSSAYNGTKGLVLSFNDDPDTTCDLLDTELSHSVVIEDSRFYQNTFCGILIDSTVIINSENHDISIKSCSIYNNNYFGLLIAIDFQMSFTVRISDTDILYNTKNWIYNSHRVFLSNVTIAHSLSTGLTLKGSSIIINNTLILRNNTGFNGGGIAMNGSSYIYLFPEGSLEFIGNHALNKGGGFYNAEHILCPFISIDSDDNSEHERVQLKFSKNTAGVVGDDSYGIMLPANSISSVNNTNISSTTEAVMMCFCESGVPDYENCVTMATVKRHIFPGQKIKFSVVMFGLSAELSTYSITDGSVDIRLYDPNYAERIIKFETQPVAASCSLIEFLPNASDFIGQELKVKLAIRRSSELNIINFRYETLQLNFTVSECPIGFSVNDSGICDCTNSISGKNVTCDISTFSITHSGLRWIGTRNTSALFNAKDSRPDSCIISESCLLFCISNVTTFTMNETDRQCRDNRGKILCGSCKTGYSSLIGSNRCGKCDGKSSFLVIAWIALFAAMGIAMVVFLIALNLTISQGTLNGLLFYANIVKLYEPVFSKERALPVLAQVISWINLDFGIETCFFDGMDRYAKEWLQFVFPFYLWIIIVVIILLCRRYGKVSRMIGSNTVPVLSTLLFLSYSKLVRTVVIAMDRRDITLHCSNETTETTLNVWYEDPNVEYGKGKHAVLFTFALLVSLFFIIPYTVLLLFSPLLEKYLSGYKVFNRFWSWLKPIIDAHSGPMKDNYRFWPGLLLLARIPMLSTVILIDSYVLRRSYLLCVVLIVLAILFSLGYCSYGFYRKRLHDIIEVWFLLNLCIMTSIAVISNDSSVVVIWFNVFLGIFTASFVAIIGYHLHKQLLQYQWYKSLLPKKANKKQEELTPVKEKFEEHKTVDIQMSEIKPKSTDVQIHRRESVVELFDTA